MEYVVKSFCSLNHTSQEENSIVVFKIGPLLYMIYMNDLPNCVEDVKVTMYAGTTSVGNTSKKVSDIKTNIIPDLLSVCDSLKVNKLSLNAIKTELMFIGTTQNITKISDLIAVRVDVKLIKRANKVEYCHLVIDENMKWDEHVAYISSNIRQNLGLVTLYLTLIEPYFRYCNTV